MTESSKPSPPYLAALTTFVAVFAVYPSPLPDGPALGCTGISRPPRCSAFPTHPATHVLAPCPRLGPAPVGCDYAKRINIFAAFCSAASAGLWFLVAERWLRSILSDRLPRLLAAFAGVFAGATAWSVWNQSVVTEKVYTVSLLSIALSASFAVRWADEAPGARRDRWLLGGVSSLP